MLLALLLTGVRRDRTGWLDTASTTRRPTTTRSTVRRSALAQQRLTGHTVQTQRQSKLEEDDQ
jgi:hypothetical protein